ncbi:hypothetical protein Y1Q_0022639 [Alligator mississippiensis]|uniref:Uncharacterized protein n=1 Tax=Alligator mississippiensis TaxID=8496 RepID=A0A151PH32_ALLMI|nr:hypothetical protein Y1Q_0022639 [Alligator mississippiensis]
MLRHHKSELDPCLLETIRCSRASMRTFPGMVASPEGMKSAKFQEDSMAETLKGKSTMQEDDSTGEVELPPV